MALYPTSEQIAALLAGPDDRPVVMLNLLRFKPQADATAGASAASGSTMTGREAYERYARAMRQIVESQGGRFIWAGNVDTLVIGEADAAGFDVVGIVEYPSRRKFVEIATSDRVREIGVDRAAGLESQWLIATTTHEI
jgi:uncharacterized protein (DUF1330 family)